MINPVIFHIGNFSLRWYGVIVMIGVIVGSLIVERELKRRGEDPETIWDALVWWVSFGPVIKTPIGNIQLGLPIGVLPAGIIGARLWYVINATLGGDTRYVNDASQIYKVWEGGLHIYGGILLGAVVLLLFLRSRKLDPWLFLDVAGPALFVGQAIGRIANFINQELYGPPTTLPWGIRINPTYGIYQIPLEVQGRSQQEILNYLTATRFHPTFAYEMIWNLAVAGLLLWMSRRYEKAFKPGTIFAIWLMAAGVGRTWIELFFRPDQPKIPGTIVSYTALVAMFMTVLGAILLMARYKALSFAFAENWEEEYQVSGQKNSAPKVEEESPRVKRLSGAKVTADDNEIVSRPVRRKTPSRGTKTTKTKKSS